MSATTDQEERDMLTETLHDIENDELTDQFEDDLDLGLLALITLEDEETGAVAEDLQAAGLL